MKFAIVRSTVTGYWGYCPEVALPFFLRNMEYSEDQTGNLTSDDAILAARADKSVPACSTFTVLKPKALQVTVLNWSGPVESNDGAGVGGANTGVPLDREI